MDSISKKTVLMIAALWSLAYAFAIDKVHGLPLPTLPDSLHTREQKVEYAATHYWDAMDFGEAELAEDEAFMEQSMVNYLFFLDFLQTAAKQTALSTVQNLLGRSKANINSYKLIGQLAAKYLYDYASPMRNEDLYDIFIDAQLGDTVLSNVDRMRIEEQRTLMNLNRPGRPLNDFSFTLVDDSKHDFSAYRHPGSHTLLIFYDPDCDECIDTICELSRNTELENRILNDEWQVFSIARYGTEEAWRKRLPQLPQLWVNGYDCNDVEGLGTYDLPAAPTVLTVNQDGTVAQKYVKALEQWLHPAER